MNRIQWENIYKAYNLPDYQLNTNDDLLKLYGIDYKSVNGYQNLNDPNKAIYEKFITNFFNAWGLEYRMAIIPNGIYWVEDIEYLVKKDPKDDYYTLFERIIFSLDFDGNKTVLRRFKEKEEFQYFEKVTEEKTYLRFEYQHGFYEDGKPRKEWLHILNEKEWY